ncbi:hypothetical protein RUM43_006618 [Polyplax serrata]|uniref:Uncharacterized protein n=1 Tax=Polyplax serrata TaxID=468196 RepID=A0AAN8S5K2_POLSC
MEENKEESKIFLETLSSQKIDELQELRCRLREAKTTYRNKQRECQLRKIRYISDVQIVENINRDELVKLAHKLKHKGQVNCGVLQAIMNSLLESKDNIKTLLDVDGALQGLLRALSGQNENFQLLAARCICNLALGNEKSSFQVLKASDSYLLAHLMGKNHYVMEACAIALGNFSCHGVKPIQRMLLQGFFQKIIHLVKTDDELLEGPPIYALTQLVYHGFDVLSPEYMQEALKAVIATFQKKSFLVVFLVSILSANPSCHEIIYSHSLHKEALKHLLVALKDKDKEAVYYLRIISNCMSTDMAGDLMNEGYEYILRESVRICLHSERNYLRKECMGLVGNIINHPNESVARFGLGLLSENLVLMQSHMDHGEQGASKLTK